MLTVDNINRELVDYEDVLVPEYDPEEVLTKCGIVYQPRGLSATGACGADFVKGIFLEGVHASRALTCAPPVFSCNSSYDNLRHRSLTCPKLLQELGSTHVAMVQFDWLWDVCDCAEDIQLESEWFKQPMVCASPLVLSDKYSVYTHAHKQPERKNVNDHPAKMCKTNTHYECFDSNCRWSAMDVFVKHKGGALHDVPPPSSMETVVFVALSSDPPPRNHTLCTTCFL
jgi:hypothetical protein